MGRFMSDVFISYARTDRNLAQALAKDLKELGYRVWWDAELVGSDDFQDVILAALAEAKAAVVIWTHASIKSAFVRDEARFALHHKKLIAVRTPQLGILDIPFGFQGQHTDDLADRGQIVRALSKLSTAPHAPEKQEGWESIKQSGPLNEVLDWLESNPVHEKREEAFQLVRRLMSAKPENISRSSNIAAFLSGLLFRMPRFQLSSQGNWSSIGYSVGLIFLLFAGYFTAKAEFEWLSGKMVSDWNMSDDAVQTDNWVYFPLMALVLCGLIWIGNKGFSKLVDQKLFTAAWIVGILVVLFSGLFFVEMAQVANYFILGSGGVNGSGADLFFFLCGVLLSAIYFFKKVRTAR
jgi:hypothetical protein